MNILSTWRQNCKKAYATTPHIYIYIYIIIGKEPNQYLQQHLHGTKPYLFWISMTIFTSDIGQPPCWSPPLICMQAHDQTMEVCSCCEPCATTMCNELYTATWRQNKICQRACTTGIIDCRCRLPIGRIVQMSWSSSHHQEWGDAVTILDWTHTSQLTLKLTGAFLNLTTSKESCQSGARLLHGFCCLESHARFSQRWTWWGTKRKFQRTRKRQWNKKTWRCCPLPCTSARYSTRKGASTWLSIHNLQLRWWQLQSTIHFWHASVWHASSLLEAPPEECHLLP